MVGGVDDAKAHRRSVRASRFRRSLGGAAVHHHIRAEVTERRTELLAALLTIWRWGRITQGIVPGRTLGSFEQWGRWVRDPLLALGCKDPADRVIRTCPSRLAASTMMLGMHWIRKGAVANTSPHNWRSSQVRGWPGTSSRAKRPARQHVK
jgi:hypothetical protein